MSPGKKTMNLVGTLSLMIKFSLFHFKWKPVELLAAFALKIDYNVYAVHQVDMRPIYPDAERVISVITLHADVSFADSSVLHKSIGILSRLVKKLVHPKYEINKKNSLLF